MKTLVRAGLGAALLAAIVVAWQAGVASWAPMRATNDALQRILDLSYFEIGSLQVTPRFLFKAVVYLLLLGLSARFGRRLIRERILARTSMDEGLQYAVSVGIGYLIVLIGLTIGLQSLGLNLTGIAFLGGAVGIGVGVGLQPIVHNFVAGLILLVERPIKVGDRIEIQTLTGDVVKIAGRSTWVRTNDNVVIIVPNSEFISQRVTNWTANDRRVRIALPVGTAYSSDPEGVRLRLLEAARQHPDVLTEPAPDVVFVGFGDSSLDFELRVWTLSQVRTPQVLRSELYFAIFRIFKREGIEIPFPQRDVHLRSIAGPIVVAPPEAPG